MHSLGEESEYGVSLVQDKVLSNFWSFALSRFYFVSCVKRQLDKNCLWIICPGGRCIYLKSNFLLRPLRNIPLSSAAFASSPCVRLHVPLTPVHPVSKITFSAVLLVLKAISDITFLSYLRGYLLNLFSDKVMSKVPVNTLIEVKSHLY